MLFRDSPFLFPSQGFARIALSIWVHKCWIVCFVRPLKHMKRCTTCRFFQAMTTCEFLFNSCHVSLAGEWWHNHWYVRPDSWPTDGCLWLQMRFDGYWYRIDIQSYPRKYRIYLKPTKKNWVVLSNMFIFTPKIGVFKGVETIHGQKNAKNNIRCSARR